MMVTRSIAGRLFCGLAALLFSSGCSGGSGQSAVPQSPSVAQTSGPNPQSSSTTVLQRYSDSGSRAVISGLIVEPENTASVEQSNAVGANTLYDTFEDKSTALWTTPVGTWTTCTYPGSSEEFCGTATGDQAIALTAAGAGTGANYRLESWVRLQSDGGNASLISRVQDASHFYEFELRTYNGIKSWFLWKNVGGNWISLAGGNYTYAANTYYRLRLDSYGSSFSASISTDGTNFTLLGTAADTAYGTGNVGLRDFGTATTSFDDVQFAPLIANPQSGGSVAAGTGSGAASNTTGTTSQSVNFTINVPATLAVANADSYVSPASKSVSISIGSAGPTVTVLSGGTTGCGSAGTGLTCNVSTSQTLGSGATVTLKTFSSTDGSGTPLSIATLPASQAANSAALIWSPVVASLQGAFTGSFAAGVASTISYTLTAFDGAGNAIPFGSAPLVGADGRPVTIALTNSDASGKTVLGTANYVGNAVLMSYDGDLPLPSPLTVTAATVGSTDNVSAPPVSVTQPTPSKNFTFSFGNATTLVPNSTGLPLSNPDWWNQTPDSKISVVHLGNGKYLLSWGGGPWGVIGNSPYPEDIQGSAYLMYSLANPQNFEQDGAWFRDIFQLGDPYHPVNPNALVTFYHAESDWTGPHTKVVASSYSNDGGLSWSKGSLILSPYQYVTGQGAGAGDNGAAYDPVNKRWVEFFTAIDNSPNISGNLSEAISNDPTGAPGTWFKSFNGTFSQPGIGGEETSLPNVQGQGYISSPCISWNSYLDEWVMIADWGGIGEALMTSPDLYTWSAPIKLMDGKNLGYTGAYSAYTTLVGPNDDKITGQTSRLYFAEFSSQDPRIYGRIMLEQNLTFHRND